MTLSCLYINDRFGGTIVMVKVDYIEDKNLMKAELSGRISLQEMLDYLNTIFKKSTCTNIRIMEDASNAKLDFNINQAFSINDVVSQLVQKYVFVQHACVTDSPLETAFGILRMSSNTCSKYNLKVFATHENAEDWLLH